MHAQSPFSDRDAFTASKHACLIFDDLSGYRAVAFDFILAGLRAGEKCLLATGRYTREMLTADFARHDLDADAYLDAGALAIVDVRSSVFGGGDIDPETAVSGWQSRARQAIADGYTSLRVMREVSSSPDRRESVEQRVIHENRIDEAMSSRFPFRVLCVYDRSAHSPRMIKSALQTHPVVLYNTERFAENIYYVPPGIRFSADSERQEVDLWLANAKRNDANRRALRESEEKFRLTFTSNPDAININRLDDGLFVDANAGFSQLTGYTRNEVIGRTSVEIDLWDNPRDRQRLVDQLREKGFCDNFEAQFRRKGGEVGTGLMSARIIPLQGVPHIVSITRDISIRKQVESERERLLRAIEQANELVVITDATGIISYVNPAFERITGYSSADAVGQTPRLLNSGRQGEDFYRHLWTTIKAGDAWKGRIINRRKDGELYTAECSVSPIKDHGGDVVSFVWISRDITKEIELENRVSQAQKMEAIGALAGGIAHDFNNLLFPILGLAEMMLEDNPAGSMNHENAEEIFRAAKRAGELVNQILSFSRQSDRNKTAVRIQQILKEVVKLTRSTIPSSIEMVQDIQPDCGLVTADPTQIHQVAMNLITNAFHAVAQGHGRISIALKTAELTAADTIGMLLDPGPYACLSVADNGHGIDPSIMGNIFEPYFTTKPQGKGTGLGLSAVYGIVKDHGGEIQVVSMPGEGTTFKVYLPLMKKAPLGRKAPTAASVAGGSERVLLVDDEAAVLRLEKEMLERLGYRVEARSSSVEALSAFRATPDRFDLVVTDLAMPNLTGDRLAREIMALRPTMRIIICTGFSEHLDEKKALAIGIDGFLMKPIVKSQLARLVRQVLDTRNP